jgi:hypothetical protein
MRKNEVESIIQLMGPRVQRPFSSCEVVKPCSSMDEETALFSGRRTDVALLPGALINDNEGSGEYHI